METEEMCREDWSKAAAKRCRLVTARHSKMNGGDHYL